MYQKLNIFICGLCVLALSACSQYDTIPEGAEVELAKPTGPVYKGPNIVHADMNERIATIRYGHELGDGFLIVTDFDGVQTALLNSPPLRPGSLRTADILEGTPKINQRVEPANAEQNEAYQKTYPEAPKEN